VGRRSPVAVKRRPIEILTREECHRLLSAFPSRSPAGVRNRALVVVLWRAQLRVGEAIALGVRDLNTRAGSVTVRHGKGDRRRVVGLDPQAVAVVDKWLLERARLISAHRLTSARPAPLFCTFSEGHVGFPLKGTYVREMLARAAARAGIEKRVHPHGLRHTGADELVAEGKPLTVVRRQLGHSSLAVTERYVDHLGWRDVVDAMQHRVW